MLSKRINKIERKINKKQLKPDNSDRFISKLRKLAKNILQSQPYHEYVDFRSKIQIWNKLSNNLDCQGELGLYDINACFYLNAKKKEKDFWEGKLKGLANEINGRVDGIRQNSSVSLRESESDSTTMLLILKVCTKLSMTEFIRARFCLKSSRLSSNRKKKIMINVSQKSKAN